MQPRENIFCGMRVLVTGHTGFKGSWLCEWLLSLGAEVHGYSLDPEKWHKLYTQLNLCDRLASDHRGDLGEKSRLESLVATIRPDFVFHLAAQPLVRLSYSTPVETFATNVMGTVHLLEALRKSAHECVAVMVTTDKCYENREWLHGYREEDPMGGHDPYSASKGATEIAISSFRKSFFDPLSSPVLVASARAGNVIGGGDWAPDRIVPDCFRALQKGESIPVRNKSATRPWQHVLEPLGGYLTLAAQIYRSKNRPHSSLPPLGLLTSAFNFGPALSSNRSVAELVLEIIKHTGGQWTDASDPNTLHEASKLNLSIDKAFHLLQWEPVWNFPTTVAETAKWYVTQQQGHDPGEMVRRQIHDYDQSANWSFII